MSSVRSVEIPVLILIWFQKQFPAFVSSMGAPLPKGQKMLERALSPHAIHRLPNELLAEIFAQGLPTNENGNGVHSYLATLSAICGSWRELAINTPNLWCLLAIDASALRSPRAMALASEMFLTMLSRSRSVPIDVQLWDGDACEADAANFELRRQKRQVIIQQMVSLAAPLVFEMHRVRSVSYWFCESQVMDAFLPLRGKLSKLTSLRVVCFRSPNPVRVIEGDARNLSSIVCYLPNAASTFGSVHPAAIRTLRWYGRPLPKFIISCQNLELLETSLDYEAHVESIPSPRLVRLILSGPVHKITSFASPSPILKHMDIRTASGPGGGHQPTRYPSLRTLSIDAPDCLPDLVPFIRDHPNVVALRLDGSQEDMVPVLQCLADERRGREQPVALSFLYLVPRDDEWRDRVIKESDLDTSLLNRLRILLAKLPLVHIELRCFRSEKPPSQRPLTSEYNSRLRIIGCDTIQGPHPADPYWERHCDPVANIGGAFVQR